MIRLLSRTLLLCCLLALAWSQPLAATAQSDLPIRYLRYDTEITIEPDGDFLVRETQEIEFSDTFQTAFAEIPTDLTSEVEVQRLLEGDTPYEREMYIGLPGMYSVEEEGGSVYIEWQYEPTEPGDVRTFTLEYLVRGGLWIYEEGDILEWRTVPADRSGFPVNASRVTVNLPADVPTEDVLVAAYGPDYETEVGPSSVTFEATEPMPDGTQFQVQVGFPHGLVDATPQPWQIAEDTATLRYRIEALETELTIRPDGTLGVEERETVQVQAGALYNGSRNISHRYLDRIANLTLWEGEQPLASSDSLCENCFSAADWPTDAAWVQYDPAARQVVTDESLFGQTEVRWQVPPLVRGEATTFRIQYDVEGAVRPDTASQGLDWTAVHGERDAPVEAATLILHLPPGVPPNAVEVEAEDAVVETGENNTLLIRHEGTLGPEQEWVVRLDLPPDATSASTPEWVQQWEAAQAQLRAAQVALVRQQVGFGAGGLLLLVGGLLGTGLAWYRYGRDRQPDLVAEYLSEPPSDLPPGIVAYLLDQEPTAKGAMASLFHLATLGLISIESRGDSMLMHRNWHEKLAEGQSVTTASGKMVTVPGHLVTLFNDLFPHLEQQTFLTSISSAFQRALPLVYAEMGEEASQFFAAQPTQARHNWLSYGQWLVLGGIIFGVGLALLLRGTLGWVVIAPAVALGIVGVALMVVSRWMAQHTPAGAEEAGKWLAFKRYLLNMKQYGSQAEAQTVLDEHFPYAVAMDVEEVVLRQAEAFGGRMPTWTQPVTIHGPHLWQTQVSDPVQQRQERGPLRVERAPLPSQSSTAPAGEVSAPSAPSVQEWSDSLSQSLQRGSNSLASVLSTSAGQASDTPFTMVSKATGEVMNFTWEATKTTGQVLGEILEASASGSGGGGGGYSGSSSSSRSSSRSSWGSSSGSRSSGRSSSSRRSGGGGRRGFG